MESNNNEKKYFDLDALLKPDETINLYGHNTPSKGKLQRMLLAGYYALRWIDEKIDNITDFIENITALRNESERIIGLPAASEKNDYVIILDAAKKFTESDMIIEADVANSFDASVIDGYRIQAKLNNGLHIVWTFDANKKYLSKKLFSGSVEYTGETEKDIEKLIPLLVKAGYVLKRVSGAGVNGDSGYRYIFEYKTDSNDKIDIFTNEDGEIK